MTVTESDILKAADWSDGVETQTVNGARILRKAKVTQAFSDLYRADKAGCKALGAGFTKGRDGEWELIWWGQLPVEVVEQRAASVEASRAASADIELIRPAGKDYFPFQKAGVKFGLMHSHVLIADEMGLGKTIQAIGIINNDPAITSAIIICPKSLKLNWLREFQAWLARPLTVGIVKANTWPAADIVIINYESLGKFDDFIKAREWGACILDEAHYIKNAKTLRSAYIKGRKEQQVEDKKTRSMKTIPEIRPIVAARHIRLTGTPILNRPMEAYNIISDLGNFGTAFQFGKRYADAGASRFGHDFSGAKNLDELNRRLRETCMVRRLKKDVLKEMPPKIRQIIEVELETDEQRRAVNLENETNQINESRVARLKAEVAELKDDGGAAYEAAVARLNEAVNVQFTEMAKLRHETAVAKVPAVVDHLTQILEDSEAKVIVAGHHKDVIQAIAEGVAKYNPVILTGDNSEAERQSAVDRFQTDPSVRVFIGGIMAAGVGITLTVSSHVVFAELDWVPGNITQFEDRAHRIGQTETVLVQHIVLAESLDARMAKTLVEKQTIIDQALDKQPVDQPVAAPAPEKTVEIVNSQQVESGLVKSDYDTRHPVEQNESIYQADKRAMETMTQQREQGQSEKSAALQIAGQSLTSEQVAAIHTGLKRLAGMDTDFALERNGIGFNKFDGRIGHSLAEAPALSPKQAALGQKILRKYRGQLGPELMSVILGEGGSN